MKGLANGQLLSSAEQAGFEVLITVDQNMPYQQTFTGRKISLVLLGVRTTNFENLFDLVPEVLSALEGIEPGEVLRVGIR